MVPQSPHLLVIPQGNNLAELDTFSKRYELSFVEPTVEESTMLNEQLVRMLETSNDLHTFRNQQNIQNDKKATIYLPERYLASTLSNEQKAAINEDETQAIASYCLGVQSELDLVVIKDDNERLRYLPDVASENNLPITFSDLPFHAACGDWAGKRREYWARESVALRLVTMSKILESVGIGIVIEDAFRPAGVQEGLYRRRMAWTQDAHPEWSHQELLTEAQSKSAVKPRLASHMGGSAIDATLRELGSGAALSFGHAYPEGGALVFPRSPFLTFEEWSNRQLFQVAAGLSGLTLYVGEDWHVSYGDNLAALDEYGRVRQDYVARYGPIRDFDRTTGVITEIYTTIDIDKVFDV